MALTTPALTVPVSALSECAPETVRGITQRTTTIADPLLELNRPDDCKHISTELADEFVWDRMCKKIIDERAHSFWWLPGSTFLLHRSGEGPGQYGNWTTPANRRNEYRREALHVVRTGMFLAKLCTLGLALAAAAVAPEQGWTSPLDFCRVTKSRRH